VEDIWVDTEGMGGDPERALLIQFRQQGLKQKLPLLFLQTGEASSVESYLASYATMPSEKFPGRVKVWPLVRFRAADAILIAIDTASRAAPHGQKDRKDEVLALGARRGFHRG